METARRQTTNLALMDAAESERRRVVLVDFHGGIWWELRMCNGGFYRVRKANLLYVIYIPKTQTTCRNRSDPSFEKSTALLGKYGTL